MSLIGKLTVKKAGTLSYNVILSTKSGEFKGKGYISPTLKEPVPEMDQAPVMIKINNDIGKNLKFILSDMTGGNVL